MPSVLNLCSRCRQKPQHRERRVHRENRRPHIDKQCDRMANCGPLHFTRTITGFTAAGGFFEDQSGNCRHAAALRRPVRRFPDLQDGRPARQPFRLDRRVRPGPRVLPHAAAENPGSLGLGQPHDVDRLHGPLHRPTFRPGLSQHRACSKSCWSRSARCCRAATWKAARSRS